MFGQHIQLIAAKFEFFYKNLIRQLCHFFIEKSSRNKFNKIIKKHVLNKTRGFKYFLYFVDCIFLVCFFLIFTDFDSQLIDFVDELKAIFFRTLTLKSMYVYKRIMFVLVKTG